MKPQLPKPQRVVELSSFRLRTLVSAINLPGLGYPMTIAKDSMAAKLH